MNDAQVGTAPVDPRGGFAGRLRALAHDSTLVLMAVLGALACVFAIILPAGSAGTVLDNLVDPLLLGLQVFALARAAQRSLDRAERLFWGLLAVGTGLWLGSQVLVLFWPFQVDWVGDATTDIILLGFYFAAVCACEVRPDGGGARSHRLGLEALGGGVFAASLITYFILVPIVFDREAYGTLTPSLFVFVLLDAFLVIRFADLHWVATEPRWRHAYGLLALAFLTGGLYDVRDLALLCLDIETPRGGMAELAWYAPMAAAILATRFGGGPAAPPDPDERTGRTPLGLYMAILPIAHIAAERILPLAPDARAGQELVVLFHVVVLGGLAVAQHLVGERRDRTMRQELRTAARVLEERGRMEALGRLAGGVAHDFNNLLGVIVGYRDLLVTSVDPRSRHYAEQIRDAVERAAALTGQLLAFSRRQPLKACEVELDVAVEGALDLIRRLAGEAIVVTFEPGATGAWAACDPAQLSQILLNLAGNAAEAMPRGGTIQLLTRRSAIAENGPAELAAGKYLELTVRDSGEGMDAATLKHVFEPFFTTKQLGTGLGLATVYGIALQHGGGASAESEVGVGTAVRILLPEVEAPPQPSAVAPGPTNPPPRRLCLLVIEDEAALRELTLEVLGSAGFEVLGAPDGPTALALAAARGSLDGVVTDMVMPGMNGLQVAQQLRERWPRLPVLFVSGYLSATLAQHGLAADESVMVKPYRPSELVERVRQLVDAGRSDPP